MAKNIKKQIKLEKDISYLNKDFDSFRAELVRYANTYYSDKITDFTENGLGGLLVDMAAYVGDSLSYYLDHQFNELNIETAIENKNVEKLIRNAGVKLTGVAPSFAIVDISIQIPAEYYNFEYVPKRASLPKVLSETTFTSRGGIIFTLLNDVDFSERDSDGNLLATTLIGSLDANGNPASFVLTRQGEVTSAQTIIETHTLNDQFIPFRTISLRQSDVGEILEVKDTDGNVYYEVESLTQDTVFVRSENNTSDATLVQDRIQLLPAPYRFTSNFNRQTGKTQIQFGSGRSEVFDDDVIPDPSEYALPLYGDRKVFNRVSIDPNSFLDSRTLGVSPRSTTITIRYRRGGGLDHNVTAGAINSVSNLFLNYKAAIAASENVAIRGSVTVSNPNAALGGEDEPTLDELRVVAINQRNSQARVVSKEDLLARVYSLPNRFGRVFRAAVRDNPRNPLASLLYIISRDATGRLINSPDTLKENLATYVNQFRLVSDAIDVLDAPVINVGINYTVSIEKNYNYNQVLRQINTEITRYMDIKNFQIDQPINKTDLLNLIVNVEGVLSMLSLEVVSKNSINATSTQSYSDFAYSPRENTDRGLVFPSPGGIFEVKYPQSDIVGRAI
jgi:hypothetical protein